MLNSVVRKRQIPRKKNKLQIYINTKKYHVFAPMGRFQLELIYLHFSTVVPSSIFMYINVVITTKGLQDININILDGTTVQKKVN